MSNIISIKRANARTLEFTITYSSTGTAYNLTGKTVKFTVKERTDIADNNNNALIDKTITSFSSPTTGVFDISLTPTDTDIPEKTYKWDILIKTDDTDVVNSETGIFIIDSKVTRNE